MRQRLNETKQNDRRRLDKANFQLKSESVNHKRPPTKGKQIQADTRDKNGSTELKHYDKLAITPNMFRKQRNSDPSKSSLDSTRNVMNDS